MRHRRNDRSYHAFGIEERKNSLVIKSFDLNVLKTGKKANVNVFQASEAAEKHD